MNQDYIKVAAAIPHNIVADCNYNTERILSLMETANNKNVEIIVFPELSITSYSCLDLFLQNTLIENALNSLKQITEKTKFYDLIAIVGLPIFFKGNLYNCAAVIAHGKICGIVPKTYLPNYREFYEKRWFSSSFTLPDNNTININGEPVPFSRMQLFNYKHTTFGIEICEDLWAPISPSSKLALLGAELIFNLSASNSLYGKREQLKRLISQQSLKSCTAYIYSSSGFGESSQDSVFGGNCFISEVGEILASSDTFSLNEQLIISDIDPTLIKHHRLTNTTFSYDESSKFPFFDSKIIQTEIKSKKSTNDFSFSYKLNRNIDPYPFIPSNNVESFCEEILNIQSLGLIKRMMHTKSNKLVIGISGGLDSTLAFLVCIRAIDRLNNNHKDIIAITMPGFGTSKHTYHNAISLMNFFGVTIKEINISNACNVHFSDIGFNSKIHNKTYENIQARERTQILMDIANQIGGLVVGTGDLSELALGWATYNGDHMSMYSVNASVPKTLIKTIISYLANNTHSKSLTSILQNILNTPISPELLPLKNSKQNTEELIGPYCLHDFFLYHTLTNGFRPSKVFYLAYKAFSQNYNADTILKWLKVFYSRFFSQQFKRSCLPDGPQIGICSLSPRSNWKMPSDASAKLWIEECDTIKKEFNFEK